MKKLFAMLLVFVMVVSCFAGCTSKKGKKTALGESLNQLGSVLENAEAIKEDFSASFTVTFNQPIFAEDSLATLLGEDGAALIPILSPFIKNNQSIEIPVSLEGVATQNGAAKFVYTVGTGADALSCTCVIADNDIFVNMKEIYEWMGNLLAPILGGALPVWSSQNAYVSFMDLIAMIQGMSDSEGIYGDVEVDNYSAQGSQSAVASSPADMLEGILGAGSSVSPEMLTALVEGLSEAIPEQGVMALLDIIEEAMTNAGMFAVKDGYMTITLNGDTMKKFPASFAAAADGKLGTIIDFIIAGIQNSDNDIIAALIPAGMEIDGQKIEDELLDEIKNAKEDIDAMAAQLKEMNFAAVLAFKTTKKGVEVNYSIQFDVEEDGLSGTIKLSATAKLEATDKVTIQAPNNVMTETELSDFLASFME